MPQTSFAADGQSVDGTFPKVRSAGREGYQPHVGLMAGYAASNEEFSNQDGAVLLDVGFQPVVPFSIAAQYQYIPGSVKVPGAKFDYNTSNLLLKGVYNFGGDNLLLRNSYLGAKSGAVMTSLEDNTDTAFAIGPTAGFDIPVDTAKSFSLGAELSYLGVIGENTPDQASLLGAAKYWF